MSQIEPEEAFEELAQNILGRVNVALPGVVESYDEASNTATVRPAVRLHRIDEDTEERIAEKHPAIPRVPVARPQFGSYFELECPLQPGDHVLLLVCDRSIDEYVSLGNADNVPQDVRRFDWSDAVAFPVWLRARETDATTRVKVEADGTITVEGTNIKLGDAATKAVALAPDVATNFAAIELALGQIAVLLNAPPGPVNSAPGSVTPYSQSGVASTKVTAE